MQRPSLTELKSHHFDPYPKLTTRKQEQENPAEIKQREPLEHSKEKSKKVASKLTELGLQFLTNIILNPELRTNDVDETSTDTINPADIRVYIQNKRSDDNYYFVKKIRENQTNDVAAILFARPQLLNTRIYKDLTPLAFAIYANATEVAEFLIQQGADINREYFNHRDQFNSTDRNNINAYIETILTRKDTQTSNLLSRLSQLESRIKQEKVKHLASVTEIDDLKLLILKLCLKQIKRAELEKAYPDKLLDLYLTIKTLFNIAQKNNIEERLRDFFRLRETILCGDSHDYGISKSLANHLCAEVAETIFPIESSPQNVLLKKAITENRKQGKWVNLVKINDDGQFDSNVPKPYQYFRSKDNRIHIYKHLLHRVITNLKKGDTTLENIWEGTDPENNLPLSSSDLEIIKQRTPTFATLVTYTEHLHDHDKLTKTTLDVYTRLRHLRHGLQKGDVYNEGTENNAGSRGYLAVAEFIEWWSMLDKTDLGKEIKMETMAVRDEHTKRLGNILLRLLNTTTGNTRNDYCIQIIGRDLQAMLDKEIVKKRLKVISDKNKLSANESIVKSEDELAILEKTILQELKMPFSRIITLKQHIFGNLLNNELFSTSDKDAIDYALLSDDLTMLRRTLQQAKNNNDFALARFILGKDIHVLQSKRELQSICEFLTTDIQNIETNIALIKTLKSKYAKFNQHHSNDHLLHRGNMFAIKDSWADRWKFKHQLKNQFKHYPLDKEEIKLVKRLIELDQMASTILMLQDKALNGRDINLEIPVKIADFALGTNNIEKIRTLFNKIIFGMQKQQTIYALKSLTTDGKRHTLFKQADTADIDITKEQTLPRNKKAKAVIKLLKNAATQDEINAIAKDENAQDSTIAAIIAKRV